MTSVDVRGSKTSVLKLSMVVRIIKDQNEIKMKGKETRRIYTMNIFFISQSELKLLTGVSWYDFAMLELKVA